MRTLDLFAHMLSLAGIPLGDYPESEPGDTMRLRMRLAGRLTDLDMTLDQLDRPALVRYHTVQDRMPDATYERHFEPAAGGF